MKTYPMIASALIMMASLSSQAGDTDTPITIVPVEPAPSVEIKTIETLKLSNVSTIDLFSVLDGNDDENLSRHEVRKRPALTRYFHKLDTDRNGLLDRKEFAALGMGHGFHFGPGRSRLSSV